MFLFVRRMIRKHLVRRFNIPEIPPALERLRTSDFMPDHIFDVGAYSGEFAKLCRGTWPRARITCFEVLPHRVAALRAWCTHDGNAILVESLLGATSTPAVPFHELESASSIFDEHTPQAAPVRTYPMQTIDELVKSQKASAPNLLKLDVQGYELEVLKGAQTTLPKISVILAEVNLIDIHKGAPVMDELILFMREKGFVAYDICGLTRRPLDNALWQADFIFVPRESALRSDKRWQSEPPRPSTKRFGVQG
jgi:FkbM family methyltransferase